MDLLRLKEATRLNLSREPLIKEFRQGFERCEIQKARSIFEEMWPTLYQETETQNRIVNAKFFISFLKNRSSVLKSLNRDARRIFKFIIEQLEDWVETFEAAKRLGRKVIDEKHFQMFQVWCIFALAVHFAFR